MQIPVRKMQTWGIVGLGKGVHVKPKQPQEEKAKELGLAEKERSPSTGVFSGWSFTLRKQQRCSLPSGASKLLPLEEWRDHDTVSAFEGVYKRQLCHHRERPYAIEWLKPVKKRPPLHRMSVQCPGWGLRRGSSPFPQLGKPQQLLHLSRFQQ